MTIAKRFFTTFSAFALCVAIALGSFSFSYAVNDFEFPFTASELPSYSSASSYLLFAVYSDNSDYAFYVITDSSPIRLSSPSGSLFRVTVSSSGSGMVFNKGAWHTVSFSNNRIQFSSTYSLGNPFPYASSNISGSVSPSTSFNYSLSVPVVGKSYFSDYSPFYFPELPYGYFDGHINSVDGSFTLDLGQVQGVTSSSGTSSGSGNTSGGDLFAYEYGTGYLISGSSRVPSQDSTFELEFDTSSNLSTSGTWSATDVEGDIQYVPSFDETSRFRTWAVVSASSYCYFVCDTRNTISGSLESVNGDKGKLRFSAVGSNGVHYPFYALEFDYFGRKVQTLSALPNGFTVDFIGGSLTQDSDSGIWSVDPLYHGVWLSSGSPPVVLSSLSDDSYKWLANPVFGESSFVLNFLDSINHALTDGIPSAISNQTSTFQNMDAPSNFDPTDVNNMLEYGSLESDFQAPSTDDIFTVDSGTFTDGMGFWRDRMNELLFFSGSPALPMTIFSLTLGLAVLIIGRRVSGGGAA